MPTLIGSVGLPRSGKSTILRELSNRISAPIVSKDAIRLALHGMPYVGLAEPMVRAISKVMVHALFLSGHEIVLADETHFSKAARDFMADGPWRTRWIVVETPKEVCLERAVATDQSYLIPVIEEMAARYEPLGKLDSHYDTCTCTSCTTWYCMACGYKGPAGRCDCPREVDDVS